MARSTAGDDEYATVAIIGDSRSDGKEGVGGVNDEVLSKIFAMIKKNNPRAVFFSGDLTLGLEEEEVAEGLYQENPTKAPVQNTQQEDHWAKAGFVYDSKAFKKSLNHFSRPSEAVSRTIDPTLPCDRES